MKFATVSLLLAAPTLAKGSSMRGALANKVTPIEKVLELMHSLQAELETESKKAAAEYDKAACACKDQADEKQYLLEKSDKKLAKLAAEIAKLGNEVTALNGDVSGLSQSIAALELEATTATTTRETEHTAYLAKDKDVTTAIDQLGRAIDAMKDSKSAMSGAKLDLAQQATQAVEAASTSVELELTERQMDAMAALTGLGGSAKQEPTSYEYHSNQIVETLDGLKKLFLQKKKEQDDDEFEARSAYEKRDTDLKNSIQFQSKDKAQKEKISAYKQELKEKTTDDQTEEQNDRNSNHASLQALTSECETTASNFDTDSNTRAAELTAMASAIDTLKAGVFLQTSAHNADGRAPNVGTPPSFLQVVKAHSQVVRRADGLTGPRRVAELLASNGHRFKSHILALASMQVRASEDHFVKVRQLIKDLMARLEKDAQSEASQKSFCDEAMSASINSRDGAIAQLETLAANRRKLESESAGLQQDIAELSAAIADAQKALIDATQLREQESADNAEALATAEKGKVAVSNAVQTLKDFYGAALLEVGKSHVPYNGAQDKSKAIIGLLEVIQSDFERDITTITNEESVAQQAFDSMKSATELDINEKTSSQNTKDARVLAIKDLLVTNDADNQEQEGLKKTALDTLADLHSQCVAGEETYADRVAKREKEIASLKEALDILDNWQN